MFKPGVYEHESGWALYVGEDGVPFLSPKAPLSARLSDIFDLSKWRLVQDGSSKQRAADGAG